MKKILFIAVVLMLVSTVAFAKPPGPGGPGGGKSVSITTINQYQSGGLTVSGSVWGWGTSHATTGGTLALNQQAGAGKGMGASQSAYGNISSTGSSFGWGSSFVSKVCGFFGFTQGQSVTQIK